MAKRIICTLLWLTVLILLPISAQAVPPHDVSNDVGCTDCHSFAKQDGIIRIVIPRGEEQETACKNCHSPGGQAASMSSVGNHVVNGGTTIIDCGSCHNPHRPETTTDPHTDIETANLKLIRGETRHVAGALDLAIFQQRPDHFAFDEDDEPWNGICQTCHTETNYHTNDGSADHTHFIDTACTSCHPHGEGFMPAGGACDACHGAPPDTGAHVTHFGGTAEQASYGGTDNDSDDTDYVFQCGNCHPISSSNHNNGTVEVELYDAGAPVGSLKSLNPPTADYTTGGTIYTDPYGIDYTLGTCANIYCHSKTDWYSPDPISNPIGVDENGNFTYDPYTVTEFKVYSSVSWGDSPLDCNSCHRNPPQTSYQDVQAGVGNSHAWIDHYGYENLHAYNHGFDPLTCRTCHYDTVTDDMTWSRSSMDITTFDDVPIANKAYHVNGEKDVAFDADNDAVYETSSGTYVHELDNAFYTPGDKTCENVGCHINQLKPEWGKPYRWWGNECNICHQM